MYMRMCMYVYVHACFFQVYDQVYIFDDSEVREWNIVIGESDLDVLLADPKAEEYVPCSMEFEGRTVWEGVGCRFKVSVVC